jgi:hypothetical protein
VPALHHRVADDAVADAVGNLRVQRLARRPRDADGRVAQGHQQVRAEVAERAVAGAQRGQHPRERVGHQVLPGGRVLRKTRRRPFGRGEMPFVQLSVRVGVAEPDGGDQIGVGR